MAGGWGGVGGGMCPRSSSFHVAASKVKVLDRDSTWSALRSGPTAVFKVLLFILAVVITDHGCFFGYEQLTEYR